MELNTIAEVRVLQDLMEEFGGHLITQVRCAIRGTFRMMWRAVRSFLQDESSSTETLPVSSGTMVASEEA